MNDLAERVAVGVRRNRFERTGRLAVFDPAWVSDNDRDDARAAIETVIAALKEPSDSVFECGYSAGDGDTAAKAIWQAMLAQAEKEFLGDG